MPKVSVVIPVYNAEKYLRACLDSVINQDFADFEAILVDDGSQDNSFHICREYAEKDGRFRVFHKENGGVSSARNKGLDEMTGEYVCFADSDDALEPDYISILYHNLIKTNSTASAGNYYNDIRENTDNAVKVFSKYTALCSLFNVKNGMRGWAWAKLFDAEIIRKNRLRFNENLTLLEDLLFEFEYFSVVSADATVCFTQNQIYHYINREESALTERGKSKTYKDSWFDSIRCTDMLLEKAKALAEKHEENPSSLAELQQSVVCEKTLQCVTQMRIIARCKATDIRDFKICKSYVLKNLFTYWQSPHITLKQKIGATAVLFYPKL